MHMPQYTINDIEVTIGVIFIGASVIILTLANTDTQFEIHYTDTDTHLYSRSQSY